MLKVIMTLILVFSASSLNRAKERSPDPTGLFPIEQNGKWGYVDQSGKTVISPPFDYASFFYEGLAVVMVDKQSFANSTVGKNGYIDRTGQFVITPQFDFASDFAEGLAAVSIEGRFGYIDKQGNVVIKPQFYVADDFSEGLDVTMIGNYEQGKWGYIDHSGKVVIHIIPVQFDSGTSFAEGLAPVEIEGKWGYIDKTGKIVIRPQFADARPFNEGLAAVEVRESKWGFIDRTGTIRIKPNFQCTQDILGGLARIDDCGEYSYLIGYINTNGRYIWKKK